MIVKISQEKKYADFNVEQTFDELGLVLPFKCRACGEKSEYTYDKSSKMYGSPLVVCSHCKSEQLVYGRLEPALYDKFRVIANYKAYTVVAIISLIIALVAFALWWVFPSFIVEYPSAAEYSFLIMIYGLIFFVVSLILVIEIYVANKKRGVITILKKSQERMKNPEYVRVLLDLGHEVPKKYWPKDYKPKPIFKQMKPKFVKE